jgi:hypothetical protein
MNDVELIVLDDDDSIVEEQNRQDIKEEGISVNDKVNDKVNDDVVQVVSPQQAEREFRRKRRRRLYRLLKQPGAVPSFLAVLSEPTKEEEKENEDSFPPPVVVIDVDEYLGLKSKSKLSPTTVSSMMPPTTVHSTPSNSSSSTSISMAPTAVVTSSAAAAAAAKTTTHTPAEEGWYEGVRLIAMPEDALHLSELQQWIRHHLEYFSATEEDVQMSQAGRRTPTVRGKVGIRCIHCARHVRSKRDTGEKGSWPPGAVSYPHNISGLYSGCSQKPQLHFQHCPYLPHDSKLRTMLQDARANQLSNTPTSSPNPAKRKRVSHGGISALMYYTISCQRIGMVQLPNGTGMRFGRDLQLEPLDFDSVRVQVEQEHPELAPKQSQPKLSAKQARAAPDRVASNASTTSTTTTTTTTTAAPMTPFMADETCQQVLQQAMDEANDDSSQQTYHRFCRKSDKRLVTDYMFLALSQMAICHASRQDFLTRGKKTKLMRLGFAGFSCRHCQHEDHSAYSCRSFSSAPDNLSSAISNSFAGHLQKCAHVPASIQQALQALKRIHGRQMQQLPYGSQRKLFFELWSRLRAADKAPPSTAEGEEEEEEWTPEPAVADDEDEPLTVSSLATPTSVPLAAAAIATTTAATATATTPLFDLSRGAKFPVTSDEETQKILKEAEDNWDLAQNDHLILPEHRNLVTDYVFLTMRQLKVAMPTSADFRGNRRNNVLGRMAGMCCTHCAGDRNVPPPSGRSFPSAPDNMASALNSSLYNHMQNCPHMPPPLKRAFQHVRKLHSAQCSGLAFGSQRRFFNKVYAKLKLIPIPRDLAIIAPVKQKLSIRTTVVDSKTLQNHSFVSGGGLMTPYWQCLACRMVPFEFRALGSLDYACPTIVALQHHVSICQKDGIHLGWVKLAASELRPKYKGGKLNELLERLVRVVVGGDEELTRLFATCGTNEEYQLSSTSGLWRRLPSSVDYNQVQSVFEGVAKELGLSSTRLLDHPKWIRYLQLVSPCFQCPIVEEEEPEIRPAAQDDKDGHESAIVVQVTSSETSPAQQDQPEAEPPATVKVDLSASHASKQEDQPKVREAKPSETSVGDGDVSTSHSSTQQNHPIVEKEPEIIPAAQDAKGGHESAIVSGVISAGNTSTQQDQPGAELAQPSENAVVDDGLTTNCHSLRQEDQPKVPETKPSETSVGDGGASTYHSSTQQDHRIVEKEPETIPAAQDDKDGHESSIVLEVTSPGNSTTQQDRLGAETVQPSENAVVDVERAESDVPQEEPTSRETNPALVEVAPPSINDPTANPASDTEAMDVDRIQESEEQRMTEPNN